MVNIYTQRNENYLYPLCSKIVYVWAVVIVFIKHHESMKTSYFTIHLNHFFVLFCYLTSWSHFFASFLNFFHFCYYLNSSKRLRWTLKMQTLISTVCIFFKRLGWHTNEVIVLSSQFFREINSRNTFFSLFPVISMETMHRRRRTYYCESPTIVRCGPKFTADSKTNKHHAIEKENNWKTPEKSTFVSNSNRKALNSFLLELLMYVSFTASFPC